MRYNADRANLAIKLIWIILGLDILLSIIGIFQYNTIQNISAGVDISDDTITFGDLTEGIFAIIYTIVYIVSVVTFIRWFRRAYFNLHTQVSYLAHDESWAAGAWFIPILNLFRPYQIMRELYDKTDELLSKKMEGYTTMLRGTVVGWWWFLWLITNFLSNIATRMTFSAEYTEDFLTAYIFDISSSILAIPLAFLAIKVIKDYAKMEAILYQLRDGDDALLTHIQDNDILDATL